MLIFTFAVGSCILNSQLDAVFTHEKADVKKKETEIFMAISVVVDIILQYSLIMREPDNLRPFLKRASPWGF